MCPLDPLSMLPASPPPIMGGISGKKPEWKDIGKAGLHCVLCLGCFSCILWVACFVLLSILLHRANTMEVRAACAGFWDFMLVSLLSPLLIPAAYLIFSWIMWWSWYPFSGSCMLILAVVSLHITLTSSENATCVEAIRKTSSPIPWLIYAGWLKSIIYCAGAVSSLCGHVTTTTTPHNFF